MIVPFLLFNSTLIYPVIVCTILNLVPFCQGLLVSPCHVLFWLQFLFHLHNPQEAHFCLAWLPSNLLLAIVFPWWCSYSPMWYRLAQTETGMMHSGIRRSDDSGKEYVSGEDLEESLMAVVQVGDTWYSIRMWTKH